MTTFITLLLLISGVLIPVLTVNIEHKICAKGKTEACEQLARDSQLACKENQDNVNCLLNIDNGRSHIGRIFPEEAFLGANLLSDRVQVLGEVVSQHPPPEIAVIVRNNIPNDLINLKDKKYCHPGFKHDNLSPLLLLELEQAILTKNQNDFCQKDGKTMLEKHISAISEFFGKSCRPGAWTQDDDTDKMLKSKYPDLCELCGSSGCNIDYETPFNDSLNCLINNGGDIAVTTLHAAKSFFSSTDNAANFKYLCKNGTSSSAIAPCTWSKQLPSLLVVEKDAADFVKQYIKEKLRPKLLQNTFSSVNDDVMVQALSDILNLKKDESIKLFENRLIDLKSYVNELRPVPTFDTSKKCSTIKWCTYSDEEKSKCQWLAQAAMNRGIQPVVECYRSKGGDELSCVTDIAKGNADVALASADYGYLALIKQLAPLAYPDTDTRFLYTILAVKKDDNDDIKSMGDLYGKRACIPQYAGKELLAFVDTIRNLGLLKETKCHVANIFNNFVGDSCAPGALVPELDISSEVDTEKLCRQCIPVNRTATNVYCNPDVINKYYGSAGSLKCLDDNNADFAVITAPFYFKNTTQYRVICRNGSLASDPGLEVDPNCALNVLTSGEVVSKKDNSKNPDIVLALHEFERWFGQDLHKPFDLFDKFNSTGRNLLFKDSTRGLDFQDETAYIKNLKKLLEDSEKCTDDTSGVSTNMLSAILIGFVVFINIIYKF